MTNFREFLEDEEKLRGLYHSLLDPRLLAHRERLDRMVRDAYERGDHKTAERLDAELEELEHRIDSQLEDVDDGSMEDDRGEEEKEIDLDWSPQEEMARIYDQWLRGRLHPGSHDWEEKDPSYRQDQEFQRLQKTQGYAMAPKGAFEQAPTSKENALADMLRSAVLESPGANRYGVKHHLVRSMTDEQVIAAAKDAWEWKRGLRRRTGRP